MGTLLSEGLQLEGSLLAGFIRGFKFLKSPSGRRYFRGLVTFGSSLYHVSTLDSGFSRLCSLRNRPVRGRGRQGNED